MKSSPYNWVVFHPRYNVNNQMFFHCSFQISSAFKHQCSSMILPGASVMHQIQIACNFSKKTQSIWVVFHALYTLNIQGPFFHCSRENMVLFTSFTGFNVQNLPIGSHRGKPITGPWDPVSFAMMSIPNEYQQPLTVSLSFSC